MGVDINKMRQLYTKEQERTQYEDSIDWLDLEDGPNQIRLLPPFGDKTDVHVEYYVSYKVGPKGRMVIPRKQNLNDTSCELAKYLDSLYDSKDKDLIKKAEVMWPKRKISLLAINRASETNKPKLWTMSPTLWTNLLAIFQDPQYGDISDINNGVDLTVTQVPGSKNGTGYTSWTIIPNRASTPLGTAEQIKLWTAEDWFVKYKIGVPFTNEQILAAINGTEDTVKAETTATSPPPAFSSPPVAPPAQQAAKPPAMPGPPKAAPVPPPAPPVAMKNFWVVVEDGKDPVKLTELDLKQMLAEGLMGPETLVVPEGGTDWAPVQTCAPELLPRKAPAVPVSPPAPPVEAPPAAAPQMSVADMLRAKLKKG